MAVRQQVTILGYFLSRYNARFESRLESYAVWPRSPHKQAYSAIAKIAHGTIKQTAHSATTVNHLVHAANGVAQGGGEVLNAAVSSMNEINASSKKIVDIVSVIDEIAFQTNLLALNAAVEAARVGDQGKGFAVVASEVQSLAGRSSKAAKEIKQLVSDSVHKINHGAELVNKSGETFTQIVASITQVSDMIENINNAASEQTIGMDQISQSIVQLDDITQRNAALVEEAAAASQSMSERADDLHRGVKKFIIRKSGNRRDLDDTPVKSAMISRAAAKSTGTYGKAKSGQIQPKLSISARHSTGIF